MKSIREVIGGDGAFKRHSNAINLHGLGALHRSWGLLDQGVISILNLVSCANVTILDLSGNNIGYIGVKALALGVSRNIKTLNLADNNIGDEGAEALSRNKTITKLNVTRNNIGVSGAWALSINKTITSLNINYNSIRKQGAKFLFNSTTIKSLKIGANKIFFCHSVDLFSKNLSIKKLVVSGNTIMNDDLKVLCQNNAITALDVAYAIHNISRDVLELLSENTNIVKLGLAGGSIEDDGIKILCANKTITNLDVSNNDITPEGARALSKNITIKVLNISDNYICNDGVKALSENKIITVLNAERNHIDDMGAKVLSQNKTILKLDVNCNPIGEEGENAFIEAAPDNYALLEITGLSKETTEKLLPYWERNKKLNVRYTLDAIEKIISEAKKPLSITEQDIKIKINSLQRGIDLANGLLLKMAYKNSAAAKEIKSNVTILLATCVKLKIEEHQSLKDIEGEVNTILDLPQADVEYKKLRFMTFIKLYYANPYNLKPDAFVQALKVLVQSDGTLLTTLDDRESQLRFDGILASIVNKKIEFDENGFKPLDSSDRRTYVLQGVSRWMPINEDDIEFKRQIQSMILQLNVSRIGIFENSNNRESHNTINEGVYYAKS